MAAAERSETANSEVEKVKKEILEKLKNRIYNQRKTKNLLANNLIDAHTVETRQQLKEEKEKRKAVEAKSMFFHYIPCMTYHTYGTYGVYVRRYVCIQNSEPPLQATIASCVCAHPCLYVLGAYIDAELQQILGKVSAKSATEGEENAGR